jgi:hypothetical protein
MGDFYAAIVKNGAASFQKGPERPLKVDGTEIAYFRRGHSARDRETPSDIMILTWASRKRSGLKFFKIFRFYSPETMRWKE